MDSIFTINTKQLIIDVFVLSLLGLGWWIMWAHIGPGAAIGFAMAWWGLILSLDNITYHIRKVSLLKQHKTRFWLLGISSAILWWCFEGFNFRTNNWQYIGANAYNTATFALLASIAFSTVLPAIFEMATIWSSVLGYSRPKQRTLPKQVILGICALGICLTASIIVWPAYMFWAIWVGPLLFLDPLLYMAQKKSILGMVASGDLKSILALYLAGQTLGLIWEFWNYWSMPKWIYHVPTFGLPHLFEMPLLGYLGYGPFALEIFTMYSTLQAVISKFMALPSVDIHVAAPEEVRRIKLKV
jgi:hypothetical protein